MTVTIIIALAILLMVGAILYLTLNIKSKPESKKSILDFLKVKENADSYILVGSTKGFPKKTVQVTNDGKYIHVFARVMVESDDGFEKWESIEKSWRVPDDADLTTMSYVVNSKEVRITVPKK